MESFRSDPGGPPKRSCAALGGAALAVMLAAAVTFAGAAPPPPPVQQLHPLSPSFDMRVPVPPTPVTVAGESRLVYELHLTSFAEEPLVLERVDVFDVEGGRVVAEVRGSDLGDRLGGPGVASSDADPRTIAAGMHAVVYIELTLAEGEVPAALEHRIAYSGSADDRPPVTVRGARTPVRSERPVVLSPPLRGGPWAAVYDPSWERGHRRVVYTVGGRARIPGRFAIDWFKLDADGRLASDNDDEVDNWYGHGADVLAVADAVVAATRDDVAESATLSAYSRPRLEDASGNYVALDLGDGRYAFYEHLAPGSVRVAPGERVRRGQVIAALGFTGSTSGPHLHLHVADANSPLGAEGLPFVLESFEILGAYEDFDAFGDAPWTAFDGAISPRRSEERPGPNVVVDFETIER